MTDRTEHPEEPAEGADTKPYTEGSDDGHSAVDDFLDNEPGSFSEDRDDLSDDDGIGSGAHVGLP